MNGIALPTLNYVWLTRLTFTKRWFLWGYEEVASPPTRVKSSLGLIIKTNCLFPFATNVGRVLWFLLPHAYLVMLNSFQPSPVCVCARVCVFPQRDTRQSVILAMKNEARREEDWGAGSLLVLSVWAADLGPLHASKQSALMLRSWPDEVFLQLAPWWAGLEVRHNFAFPANDGSDCSPFIKTVHEPAEPPKHTPKHATP